MTIWARVLVAFMLVGAWGGMVGFHGDITQLTDQQIESAIKQRLAMDGRIDATNIHVKVEQGKVTLSGAVVTVDDKGLAEAIVTGTLVGVKSLTNNIAVVPVLVKDEAIRKAVEAALRSVPALLPDKANKIKVSVNDGIVALKGAVEKPLFRRAAEKAAASVKGVKSVTNLVEVVGKPRPDNEIEKDVVTYLQWSPLVELDAIDYKVENAVVKLKGSVDHLAHKYALASDLEKIRGVIDVDVSGVSVTKAQKKA
ncbi:MAG: BON domain-containing protein [Nitrospirae bacterium]|nr:MAG: hypothetical protein AUH21_06235 [Nitrospirae bacterium 13_2_20CM_62_7]OLB56698.1 MAG: hypothetical protein AUI03_03265 [Nitrospirae bacterium 13_2_20CM_2_62_8]TLY41289.1 MAG: BON domain-containing protein [Nitrospirota bacterium]